jgi:arylsulfatase A-like enzyme
MIRSLFLCLFASLSPASAQASVPPPNETRPNILFFLVDDLGVFDTSVPFLHDVAGQPRSSPLQQRYRTPNMERLAANGMRFCNARAFSVCTPTRAAILSGKHPARLHITTWTHPKQSRDTGEVSDGGLSSPAWRTGGMDPVWLTLPRLLQSAGYHTIHCGKAHFGPDDSPAGDPRRLGFDLNIGGFGGGGPGSYWGGKNYSAAWRKGGRDWDVPGLEKYHGTDTFLTEALTLELTAALTATVEEGKGPFFAHMSHYAVHAPFEADERFTANYPELEGMPLAFATLVEGMDKSLGDLLDTLDTLGVATKTLVVFYSDNGSDGPPNVPLRGKKGTRFDGGSRVPMIVAWASPDPAEPLQRQWPVLPGTIEDDLVTPMDFLPTLARIAGVTPPQDSTLDGHDLNPYLSGTPGTHRPQRFAVHFPHGRHNNELFTTWTDGSWKLIYQHAEREWQLTNVAFDPGEQRNMVAERPQLALAMARRMIDHLDGMKAQWPIEISSGQPLKPDLTPLEAALKSKDGQPPPPAFETDDLNLANMIRPVTEDNLYREPGWYTWCNDIIRGDDGLYHLFYVRWPKEHGFYAWLTHSEIARAVSRHPTGPYSFAEVLIPSRGEHGWNQITAHNAKIFRANGRYYLYFIGTNDSGRGFTEPDLAATAKRGGGHPYWAVLRNNQRTGVAVADRLEGPWEVLPQPVIEPAGPISTVTVNPAVWQADENAFMMVIKGDYPPIRVAQGIGVTNSPEGPFRMLEPLAFARYSEDVSVWRDDRRGLIYGILHDNNGFGVIASRDGLDWRDARHYRAIGKRVPLAKGGFLNPTRFERPMVFTEGGVPLVLGAAAQFNRGEDAYIVLIPLAGDVPSRE